MSGSGELPRRLAVAAVLAPLLALIHAAAVASPAGESPPTGEDAVIAEVPAQRWESRQRVDLGGRRLDYTATAGTLVLKDDDGMPIAGVFYTAYVTDDAGDPS